MIENLFPTAIGRYELGRDLTIQELSFIKNQKTVPNIYNSISENTSILKSIELTQLRDFIETKVSDYFNTVYKPKNQVSLKITQSWTNYTNTGQHHHKHEHQNSFLSGVFYVQADKEKDKIYFYNSYKTFAFPTLEWNCWNSESWWYGVDTGNLILFPSNLTHMVQIVESDKTRISLAFNTFPVGQVGDETDLTSLKLAAGSVI